MCGSSDAHALCTPTFRRLPPFAFAQSFFSVAIKKYTFFMNMKSIVIKHKEEEISLFLALFYPIFPCYLSILFLRISVNYQVFCMLCAKEKMRKKEARAI